jgi:pyruvate/2-oxoglutarate dehydrogenase complex dihydrolipoamide acyltransferase (E2) component
MRQTIAAAMTRSKREIPHYYLATAVDMHRAMAWLAEENLKRPVPERLLYGVLLRDLVRRARAGEFRSSELSDPTITVTSLGEQGVETVFGVIYPPQVAIVGFGRVVERPWSVEGAIASRPVVTATLSADHRVSDGHRGGVFLAAVDRLLQEPGRL